MSGQDAREQGLPLFQQHSQTSREAWEKKEGATAKRAMVLRFLHGRGGVGATDEEVQMALEMEGSTQRPRRVELVELGLVKHSGRTRKTLSGRSATVWVAV